MTMQIKDSFYHANAEYEVLSCSIPLQFHPPKYDLIPKGICTACHKGYWCNYSLSEDQLVLQNLFIHTENDSYPPLWGCTAVFENNDPHVYMGHHVYKELHHPIKYTGNILIGNKSTPTYYIDGISGIPWGYKDLKELVFENGKRINEIDHSETAKDIRKFIRTMPKSSRGFMGPCVEFDFALLGLVSDYPWWIERSSK